MPLKQILSDNNILYIRFTIEIIVLIDYNLLTCGWNTERVYIVLPVNYLFNAGPICIYRPPIGRNILGGVKLKIFF